MKEPNRAHRFISVIALALCAALIASSCSTSDSHARYELYTAFESDWVTVFIMDTHTGTTKVVAYGSPGSGGHQFGVPFEQMSPVPAPLGAGEK